MPLTKEELSFIHVIAIGAAESEHCWPQMAAAEAALESTFGTSLLAYNYLNLFGMKQHVHPVYGTVNLPTREFEHGDWEVVESSWVKYPNYTDCFDDRMNTLRQLAKRVPGLCSCAHGN